MIAFVDTNVLLDVLMERAPFLEASREVWRTVERQSVVGVVSAVSFTNLYYLAEQAGNRASARACLRRVLQLFRPVAVDERLLRTALDSGMADYEDAVQWQAALRGRADYFVTRNASDFRNLDGPVVIEPASFLQRIGKTKHS